MAGLPHAKLCLLLAVLAAPALPPAHAAPPPISLFGQLPNIASIEVSPDGTKWAAVMGDDKSAQVQVRNLADNKLISVTPAERAKVRDIMWVGNDHVVTTISTTSLAAGLTGGKREWFQLLALDLSKGTKWRPLLTGIPDTLNAAAGTPRAVIRDGEPIIMVPTITFPGTKGVLAVAEERLKRGSARLIETGTEDTRDYILGVDGKPVAREDYNQRTGEWRLLVNRSGIFHRIYTETALNDAPGVTSFGRDAGTLVLTSRKSGEWLDYEVNMADGSVSGPTDAYDGDSVIIDRRTRTAIGTVDVKLDRTDYTFFNAADQSLWRGIVRAFPGEQVRLESWNDDRKHIIVEVSGPKNGVSLYRVDRAKGAVEYLADRYAGLGPEVLGRVTAYRYKAADGLDIPAYLTVPPGRPAKNLPLIVLAHGGPAARDTADFDWWAQALASRGYAVLQPQFRGSTGFGDSHRDAGFGQWGRKMQTDLSDGVRDLVAKGIADPKRVCIVGGSYGGYAAMAGVTLDPGVYRCASAVAGVADLRAMLAQEVRDQGGSRNGTLRYWQRFMGASSVNDTSIDAFSPARLADKVTVPLQLIHGRDDTVVPIAQSKLMLAAMQKAGKPVDWLELPGEDHWLSRAPTRIAMLEAQVAFLEKHNPPDPAP